MIINKLTRYGIYILAIFAVCSIAETQNTYDLDDIWKLALKNNQTLKIASYTIDKADAGVSKAWAELIPQINLNFVGNYYDHSQSIAFEDFEIEIFPRLAYNFTASFSAPLFTGGRIINGIKLADTYRDITKNSEEITQEQMFFVIVGLYHDIKMKESQIGILERSIELSKKELSKAQLRYEVGESTRPDVLIADLDLKSQESQLVLAKNEYNIAKANLANLVELRSDYNLAEPVLFEEPEGTEDELIQRAYQNREDLKIAELNLRTSDLQKNIAWGGFFPVIMLQGQYFNQSADFPAPSYASLGVVVSLPLWDGGKTLADISEARAQYTISEIEIIKLKNEIALDVRKALADVKTISSVLAMVEAQEKLAKENYELNSVLFEVGDATALELSQALIAYNRAQIGVSNTRYQKNLAILNLRRAIGEIFNNN